MSVTAKIRFLVITALLSLTACSRASEAENGDEDAQPAPVTLYAHENNGVVPAFRTPGLLNCDPLTAYHEVRKNPKLAREAERLFLPLPDANDNEGVQYSREERQRAKSAIKFARLHNHAAFKGGEKQILRVCPQAQLVDY